MPNRNNADQRERYDHSGHSTQRPQTGDLHVPGHGGGAAPAEMHEVPGKTLEERTRSKPSGGAK